MKNMKVSAKLMISFMIVVALTLVVGFVGIFGMTSMRNSAHDMYGTQALPLGELLEATDYYQRLRVQVRNAIIYSGNAQQLKTVEADMNDRMNKFEAAMQAYKPSLVSERGIQLYNAVSDSYYNSFKPGILVVLEGAKQGKSTDVLLAEMEETTLAANQIAIDLSDLGDARLGVMLTSDEANNMLGKKLFISIMAVIGIAVIFSIVLALYLTSLIAKPLNKLKEAAQSVAKGDIDINIDYKAKDEVGQLADVFRSVISILNLLNENMKQLRIWAMDGHILSRTEADDRIQGTYQEIINGVNGIMDTFGGHFNAIPVGVSIVDVSKNVLFSNPTAVSHKSIDEDNLQIQSKDFTDEAGRVAGSLVISVDQTTVMEAQRESERQAANVAAQMKIAEKQADYQKIGVEVLVGSLERLAKGDLNIVVNDAPYDADTKEIHDNFYHLETTLVHSCTNIKSYISELSEVLGKVAEKNLNVGITREYLGDFAALKVSINHIVDTLNTVFGDIMSATEQVQGGSQQMANSSQILAQGASEQAGSVEEISSTIAEVSSQTKSNAENAHKANEISLGAKTDAETGSQRMDEMVRAMEAIREASKGIASIIKVIEDIAFQTNILALNAAVEAARAGEHGKGFAVVAEEVRTLAARSAAAAKETTEMIDNSLSRVEAGSKIAGETATALNKIVGGVTGTVDIVATIADASAQQATAISQIDHGIEQISKVTQSNTAAAEESASASEEMAGQAQTLQTMINEFTLKGSKSAKKQGQISTSKPVSAIRITAPGRETAAGDPAGNDFQIDLEDDSFGKY